MTAPADPRVEAAARVVCDVDPTLQCRKICQCCHQEAARILAAADAVPLATARYIGPARALPHGTVVEILARDDVGDFPGDYARWVRYWPDDRDSPRYRSCDASDLDEGGADAVDPLRRNDGGADE